MLDTTQEQLSVPSVAKPSSVSIILVANQQRQVIDSQFSHLEACELMWLLSLIEKHGFAAVEETLVQFLLAPKDDDYTL
jgi:hypothetical protein